MFIGISKFLSYSIYLVCKNKINIIYFKVEVKFFNLKDERNIDKFGNIFFLGLLNFLSESLNNRKICV